MSASAEEGRGRRIVHTEVPCNVCGILGNGGETPQKCYPHPNFPDPHLGFFCCNPHAFFRQKASTSDCAFCFRGMNTGTHTQRCCINSSCPHPNYCGLCVKTLRVREGRLCILCARNHTGASVDSENNNESHWTIVSHCAHTPAKRTQPSSSALVEAEKRGYHGKGRKKSKSKSAPTRSGSSTLKSQRKSSYPPVRSLPPSLQFNDLVGNRKTKIGDIVGHRRTRVPHRDGQPEQAAAVSHLPDEPAEAVARLAEEEASAAPCHLDESAAAAAKAAARRLTIQKLLRFSKQQAATERAALEPAVTQPGPSKCTATGTTTLKLVAAGPMGTTTSRTRSSSKKKADVSSLMEHGHRKKPDHFQKQTRRTAAVATRSTAHGTALLARRTSTVDTTRRGDKPPPHTLLKAPPTSNSEQTKAGFGSDDAPVASNSDSTVNVSKKRKPTTLQQMDAQSKSNKQARRSTSHCSSKIAKADEITFDSDSTDAAPEVQPSAATKKTIKKIYKTSNGSWVALVRVSDELWNQFPNQRPAGEWKEPPNWKVERPR